MLLSKHVFLSSDLVEGILDVVVDQVLFLFDLQSLHRQDLDLLFLEFLEFVPDVLVHEIGDVLAVVDLGDRVVLPLLGDHVVLLQRNIEDSSSSVLLLELADVGSFHSEGEIHFD